MKNQRMQINRSIIALTLAAAFMLAGCGPHPRFANVNAPGNAAEANETRPRRPQIEVDIESMRTADFIYVYVFRRKDGGVLDADDRGFLNEQKPPEINRVKLSDEGRAVIFGSNFPLPEPQMTTLRERFAFEDLSRPQPAGTPDANANANNQG